MYIYIYQSARSCNPAAMLAQRFRNDLGGWMPCNLLFAYWMFCCLRIESNIYTYIYVYIYVYIYISINILGPLPPQASCANRSSRGGFLAWSRSFVHIGFQIVFFKDLYQVLVSNLGQLWSFHIILASRFRALILHGFVIDFRTEFDVIFSLLLIRFPFTHLPCKTIVFAMSLHVSTPQKNMFFMNSMMYSNTCFSNDLL